MSTQAVNIANYPMYLGIAPEAPPLTMLIMGRDHTLYYEAYNDASDLNGDGVLDVGYKPEEVDYFGYFDSDLCYAYSNGRFDPTAAATDKKCSGAWSGDFLNYVTTSRIDALRKVLYGGRRIADDTDLTVLERSYIPQDAHSWGKEYLSESHDGYDISDYAPLSQPAFGTRHLFANTTLRGTEEPRLRVLKDSVYRIWEWVAIERPVAGDKCLHGGNGPQCETAGGIQWPTVPESILDLTQRTYKATDRDESTGGSHPTNEEQFDALVAKNANSGNLCGERPVSTIDGSGNPFSGTNGCTNEYYLTIFEGTIEIPAQGTYEFAVDGDDAVDLHIDGNLVASWYGGHGRCNCNSYTGLVTLSEGTHTLRFRQEEATGDDNYYLRWKRVVPPSTRDDYFVRVSVCNDDDIGREENCRKYVSEDGDETWKPAGLLQQYGEDERMLFGLMTGSYKHPYNMAGGVLRKNIESFKNEVNPETGQFDDDVEGIISTLDLLRIVDFNKSQNYQYNGGWLTNKSMADTADTWGPAFPDWGNPIGEMMYETLRYFSGKEDPTEDFMPGLTNGRERVTLRDYVGSNSYMDLPAPDWQDPYDRDDDTPSFYCSPAAQLVISDVNPSYDSDAVPGSAFGGISGGIDSLNVQSEADAIWQAEHGAGSSQHFIGQVGSNYDGASTAKTVSGLGNIRGLAPSEPTKQGSYYSAAIARYGFLTDLRDDLSEDVDQEFEQNINTFSVALSSPLPRIEIPVGDSVVAVVPFAKSVGGSGYTIVTDKGAFQPTNTIVDFFVEAFANTDPAGSDADPEINEGRPYIAFRVNFEDVEQGADHDMDAIIRYVLKVNDDNTLTVELTSEYAAGSIIHHLGYVISGTTEDGVYLEVRDQDTSEGNDPDYFLDTPAGLSPGDCDDSPADACSDALPLFASRTFEPSAAVETATVLESPLWYAAKYGSEGNEDLEEGETSPNYFLVTNAGKLQDQLEQAFEQILLLGKQSGTSAAASSAVLQTETLLYTAAFRSEDWSGALIARRINEDGSLSDANCDLCWDAEDDLAAASPALRNVLTMSPNESGDDEGVALEWGNLNDAQKGALNQGPSSGGIPDILGEARLAWLRGDDDANEAFRSRTSQTGDLRHLGDIVNSNPQFVSHVYSGSARLLGAPLYRDRPDVLYVGANDGMLHAFDAQDGSELFAFVPSALLDIDPELDPQTDDDPAYARITRLMEPDYTDSLDYHRYMVDGTPEIEEAPIGADGAWRTILVGSQGAGGRTVFALDVTDPEGFGAGDILWEFTHPDLGYNVGQPTIARLSDGTTWAAIFGNGYNSDNNRALLFVVNLKTGELIAKIDPYGEEPSPENGLASPKWTHWPQNNLNANRVYAGDLLGNLWRFDLSSSNTSAWSADLLFTANDGDSEDATLQPITARPAIAAARDDNSTLIVAFGTGSYFRVDDAWNTEKQTLYAVRDKLNDPKALPIGRDELLKQWIAHEEAVTISDIDYRLRHISANDWDASNRGWYLDLCIADSNGNCNAELLDGERVISEATFPSGSSRNHIRFTTLIPDEDPCTGGRDGFLYALDLHTGGQYESALFDLNEDDLFNDSDATDQGLPSAIGFGSGERLTVIQVPGKNLEYGYSGSGEDVVRLRNEGLLYGRQSWQQLR
jgi:type IV pilus assembly protein PilY1